MMNGQRPLSKKKFGFFHHPCHARPTLTYLRLQTWHSFFERLMNSCPFGMLKSIFILISSRKSDIVGGRQNSSTFIHIIIIVRRGDFLLLTLQKNLLDLWLNCSTGFIKGFFSFQFSKFANFSLVPGRDMRSRKKCRTSCLAIICGFCYLLLTVLGLNKIGPIYGTQKNHDSLLAYSRFFCHGLGISESIKFSSWAQKR